MKTLINKGPGTAGKFIPVTGSRFIFMHFLILFLILFLLPGSTYGQNGPYRTVENDVFSHGEELKYKVFYDSWMTYWITAGIGTMSISPESHTVQGRETFKIEVTGNSVGIFTLFYKVRDKFTSYVDKQAIVPLEFYRKTHEGSFRMFDEVVFDHENLSATSPKMVKHIPPGVQDVVSAFYYMRTMDFDTAKKGDAYYIDFYLDDSVYNSRVIFMGRDWVETSLGKFYCMGFKPQVAQGDLFKEPYPMMLWVTDDRNKIPILAKSGVYIGSITLELIEYKGLKYPLGEKPGN
jgi:hypothetical protein